MAKKLNTRQCLRTTASEFIVMKRLWSWWKAVQPSSPQDWWTRTIQFLCITFHPCDFQFMSYNQRIV